MIEEIQAAFYDIPFENSDYQNKVFMVQNQLTPARAYRSIGLRMLAKLRAIDELKFGRELEQVDIDEYQATIDSDTSSTFEQRRAAIEIRKKESKIQWEDKLLNDAIRELNCLYSEFKKFPTYTREQFELEEADHFEQDLQLQLTAGNGPQRSLAVMRTADKFDAMLAHTKQELLVNE